MYKAFFQFGASQSNQDILRGDVGGGAVPALILNNDTTGKAKFSLMSPFGVTFDVMVAAGDSKLVEISTKRIVTSPANSSVVVLSQ